MTSDNQPQRFNTLTDRARFYTRDLTGTLGRKLHEIGVHPDAITAVGLLIVAIAAYVAAQGHFFWAGLIMLLGTPLDALDGAVARAMQRTDRFGALFDSTLDRYADGFIFMALAYHASVAGNERVMLLSMVALLGSLLVSYVRARAEGLDVDCKVGVLTRMERIVIIIAMLLTGWIEAGLWLLAIGTHVTVIQRVWYVHRTLSREGSAS